MNYREKRMDLFQVPDDYVIAHCISGDMALGAGIAVKIEERYHVKNDLHRIAGYMMRDLLPVGCCFASANCKVYNLVTKKLYYQKPTYDSMSAALNQLCTMVVDQRITKIAMPRIGCGLDRLSWDTVSGLIKETFEDTDVEILVCYL